MSRAFAVFCFSCMLLVASLLLVRQPSSAGAVLFSGRTVSFGGDVMPLLRRECLPCHAEESYNRSGLSLDSYELVMTGGRHGATVVPGNPDGSLLVQKVGAQPPFGDKMPIAPRQYQTKIRGLTEQEIAVIIEWINQGAQNN
jgi:cytochrome c